MAGASQSSSFLPVEASDSSSFSSSSSNFGSSSFGSSSSSSSSTRGWLPPSSRTITVTSRTTRSIHPTTTWSVSSRTAPTSSLLPTAGLSKSTPNNTRPGVLTAYILVPLLVALVVMVVVTWCFWFPRKRSRRSDYNAVPFGTHERPTRWSQTSFTSSAPAQTSEWPEPPPLHGPKKLENLNQDVQKTEVVEGLEAHGTRNEAREVRVSGGTCREGARERGEASSSATTHHRPIQEPPTSNGDKADLVQLPRGVSLPRNNTLYRTPRSQVDTYFDIELRSRLSSIRETHQPDTQDIGPVGDKARLEGNTWDEVAENMTQVRLADKRPANDQQWAARALKRECAQANSRPAAPTGSNRVSFADQVLREVESVFDVQEQQRRAEVRMGKRRASENLLGAEHEEQPTTLKEKSEIPDQSPTVGEVVRDDGNSANEWSQKGDDKPDIT